MRTKNPHWMDYIVQREETCTLRGYGFHSDAHERERRLKRWKRQWKIELIEKENPNWEDLYDSIL